MPEKFGARLRQRREERGIDLVTIAKQTKIKQSLLEALEQDDVSSWPSGFYRRAFIRAYARAIALDPDVTLREFLDVYPEPPEIDVIAAMASVRFGVDGGGPAQRVRNAVGSAIGSLSRLRRNGSGDDLDGSDGVIDDMRMPAAPELPEVSRSDRAPDLLAIARLCTKFGRAGSTSELQPLLKEAATLLDAIGLIVWLWDGSAEHLTPAVVYGYSDRVIAQLPSVGRDDDNATAAAFRSAATCAIGDTRHANGALVVPLLTPTGCTGVLAIELRRGSEQTTSTCAVATILAALLAQLTVSVSDIPAPLGYCLPTASSN